MDDVVFLVEGPDDKRFVETVFKPRIDGKPDVVKYAQKSTADVNNLVSAFAGVCDDHYYVTDLDRGNEERGGCRSCDEREVYEKRRYDILNPFDVLVAVDAVEGWLLAGVSDAVATEGQVPVPSTTDHVGKPEFTEAFEQSTFGDKETFVDRIFGDYDYDLARERNDSFRYVADAVGL